VRSAPRVVSLSMSVSLSSRVTDLLGELIKSRGSGSGNGNGSSAELDGASLDFLASHVGEEVAFLQSCPGSMTLQQLAHVMQSSMSDYLINYEVVKSEAEAKEFCIDLAKQLVKDGLVELNACGSEEETTAAAAAASRATKPPLLSQPVRIDVSGSQAASFVRGQPLEYTKADILRARVRWSPEEERIIFKSLAEMEEEDATRQEDDTDMEEGEGGAEGGCEMCQRDMPLTRHHLIPRYMHSKTPYSSMSDAVLQRCINICRPCHSALHRFEDERILAERFSTLAEILADERFQKWIAYISKRRVNRTKEQTKHNTGMRYGR